MIKQTYEDREISMYSVKDSKEFEDIQARLLLN